MKILKRAILVFTVFAACFSSAAAFAEDAFSIGLIGSDPRQLLKDFDPLAQYLRSSLRSSGIRDVTIFVAKDMNQLRSGIQKGRIDFILAAAFPTIEMEGVTMIPSVVAVQNGTREESAIFFVRKQSSVQELKDLRGKMLVLGTPWSTAGYAMAMAELKKNRLPVSASMKEEGPRQEIRYLFAGEPINEAFRVIRYRADAGVFSSSDWEALPARVKSRLRVIHRTEPVVRLLGSFRSSFPAANRAAVETALINMSGSRKGRAALAAACKSTSFERVGQEDRNSLQRLDRQLAQGD